MRSMAKKLLVLSLVMTLLMSAITGCGSTSTTPKDVAANTQEIAAPTPEATPKPEPVTIEMMLWGDKPVGLDDVLSEFEKRTADTLNMKLNIGWTPLGDYANKLKLKLSAGEEVDSAFDAQWLQMTNFIGQKNYTELDQYFNNDQYPGLKKVFSQEMLENNKFSGHIYGVPFLQGYGEISGIYIRKDLREKYGLPSIQSISDLEAFFEAVKKNDPGIVPLTENGTGANWFQGFSHNQEAYNARKNIFGTGLAAGISANFILNADGKRVDKVIMTGDPDEDSNKPIINIEELARKWYVNGYFEKDVISQKDKAGLFKAGKAAAVAWDTANYYNVATELKKAVPGADMELFVTNDASRNMEQKAIASEFKAWNFACIPVTSKKIDRTMAFFDWLFAEKANHDLFEYGIEGKNWTADGEDKFKVPEGGTSFAFPGYQLTWNPNYIRYPSEIGDDILKYLKYRTEVSTYFKSALSGFTFNTEPVKTEVAKVGPVLDEISKITLVGMLDNPKGKLQEANEKAKKLGLEKIREEAKKQVEEFLANKP